MEALGISSTGKLNYHLKILGDLLSKTDNGEYVLSERGRLASQLLLEFPDKAAKQLRLSKSDTFLIGLWGFLLALANPLVWGIFVGILIAGVLGVITYAILVPALLMWRLAANRTKSHDLLELSKPAMVPALLFTLIFVLLFVLNQPPVGSMLLGLLFLGFAPFLGIALIEALYRLAGRL
jgi:uncharacterized membrane protein